ncbi:MAG: hypothetical protein ABH835_02870 [Patescibacteria group bacterium]
MIKLKFIAPICLLVLLFCGCNSQLDQTNLPAWVNDFVVEKESAPVENPPASIIRCTYQGEDSYYIPAACCNQMSQLYDLNKNKICSPDGGFTGQGDGQCSDYFTNRKYCEILWEDPR